MALSLACVTSMNYARRYGKGAFQPFGFASLWTAVWYLWDRVSPMASLISPAYSQHAFEPLVMTASIWGIDGIVFLMAWGASLLYLSMNMDDATEPTSNSAKVPRVQEVPKDQGCKVRQLTSLWKPFLTLAFLSLLYGEGRIVLGNFYQKPLVETMKPTVAASCIIGQYPDTNPDAMLNKTAARVAAGDWIVLWSESAVKVQGDEGEKELLSHASAIAFQGHTNRQGDNGPYLGIAYNKYDKHLDMMHNTLSLILPNGSVGFKYQKSHPVPFVESNVIASVSQQMATANTEYGTLGSAICYDFQYPDFMRQAWEKRADIVIQPAWTWGSIGNPVFVADAYRAVESGFTMLRCNSVGISAVVDPFYKMINYRESGFGGIMLMELPIAKAVWVVYPLVAPLLGWLLNVLAILYLLLAFLPTSSVFAVMSKCPNVIVKFLLGNA